MSGIYDFTIAPGAAQRFSVIGNKAKLISTSSAFPIGIRLDGGDKYACLEGQGPSMQAGKEFGDVTLSNSNAVAMSGFLFIGDDRFEDTRITGNVRVIDQGADKTLLGFQFWQQLAISAAVGAGSIIYMTAGTGPKRISIKAMSVQSTIAGAISIGYAMGGGTLIGAGAAMNSKIVNGGGGQARVGGANCAAAQPSNAEVNGFGLVGAAYVAANTSAQVILTTPMILQGANVIVISAAALNRDVSVLFDFEEL